VKDIHFLEGSQTYRKTVQQRDDNFFFSFFRGKTFFAQSNKKQAERAPSMIMQRWKMKLQKCRR